ncbi:MAG: hypothetical protein LBJ18_01320 [Rickettsiales bacterium]|jgi:hypothetical protein|nr:hypothetical protein [Rickettsiales bacterium]
MASVRKVKKSLKIGAAAVALNQRIQKLDAPHITKVSDKAFGKLAKKAGKGTDSLIKLTAKKSMNAKHGGAYLSAQKAAAKKLSKKTDAAIVKMASKVR